MEINIARDLHLEFLKQNKFSKTIQLKPSGEVPYKLAGDILLFSYKNNEF